MKTCWYCHKDLEIAEDFVGDITCKKCGVMNSFYPLPAPENKCSLCGINRDENRFIEIHDCGHCARKLCQECFFEDNHWKAYCEFYDMPERRKEMGIDYNNPKYQGKYVYLPKVGEEAEFEIKEVREVESKDPRFNFNENVPVTQDGVQVIDDEGEPVFKKKDLGYHIEAELTNGKILSITSFAAFLSVFKANNIQDGDRIIVQHPERGKWEVEKL